MPIGVSVIVCCYNSASRIAPTLHHLLRQKNISHLSWEVILVDNASTDDTTEKAAETWQAFAEEKPSLKLVKEPTPGLALARQKGIAESNFDYLVFCDDDNWLDENYLSEALSIMQSSQYIGVLGGTGFPVFEGKEPPYFWSNQFHVLAVGVQSDIEGDITNTRGVVYGAGMVLNKKAYRILQEKYSFQFLLSGRAGAELVSSEDHELCLALKMIGYKIYYSRALQFKHFIPHYRTTIQYYEKLFRGFGKSYALLHVYRVNKKNVGNIKNDYRYMCLRYLKNIVVIELKLILTGFYIRKNKHRYLDQLHQLYSSFGALTTFFKVKNSFKNQFNAIPLFNTHK